MTEKSTNRGKLAYPAITIATLGAPGEFGYKEFKVHHSGMNLREHFATRAMQAMLSNPTVTHGLPDPIYLERLAERSILAADALLQKLQ